MRKGILSLTPLGRRKAVATMKTGNMEKAEKAAAKQVEEATEQKAPANEKNYVQTIMVPKQRKATGKKEGTLAKTRKATRKK